jgi:hypothetical protein
MPFLRSRATDDLTFLNGEKSPPNLRMQPTTLSRFFVKRFSLLQRFGSRFFSLRQPRGG